jgi:hypothetical protein
LDWAKPATRPASSSETANQSLVMKYLDPKVSAI